MAKLLISTQVFENYAWNADGSLGTGDNAYWKPKGGWDYVLKDFQGFNRVAEVVMALRSQIERDNDAFREYIIDWVIVADNYLTQFEKDQLEYEGKITYGPHEVYL
jgi:hypothetical protein